ncbi:MAG: proline--tRNA ligase [Bdellovibrionales bacterium GWB1_55_8]|nr:MAG: proline--tRNA ligase [Bdellovibrionales bacterium GWB1_55_8]
MAEKITPRTQDFSEWYQDVVLQAKLADYSPVKGCMVIRPNGYAIWERIQSNLDRRIKKTGVRNAYFPLFIPESFLKKEADHVEGFAPQCAVVTYAGSKDLEEKLVVRPTSETIINSMFARWVQSYRDLPLLINQWANVVRWEMRTRLFLRTTEFLWQEGHTCHATPEEAEQETRQMLQVYVDFAEEILAMPVVPGLKSESEKFAGALRTYSIEAMMQDKKALQAGTSHNLASNFAKAFGTQFLDSDGKQKFVHQTSWGVSTRLIGGMIMTHSDDKGLVLPPRLATTHVVIVPILGNSPMKPQVLEAADKLAQAIRDAAGKSALPYEIGVDVDRDETKQPGWKFHEHELVGTPLRVEIGPRDLEKGQAVLTRRDTGAKEFIAIGQLPEKAVTLLAEIQAGLLEKARAFRDANTFTVRSYDEFKSKIDSGGFFVAPWCQDKACEGRVKEDTKATIRCLPLGSDFTPIAETEPCMVCGRSESNRVRAIFARAY